MNNNLLQNNIDPNYISGLTQADGSFFCSIKFRANLSGLKSFQFVPTFSITVDLDSISVLYSIKAYFNCGNINTSLSRHTAEFVVLSFADLVNIIIPHFDKYPLFFEKLHSYLLFKKIINILEEIKSKTRNYYFTSELLIEELRQLYLKIILYSLSMNKSSLRKVDRIEDIFARLEINKNSIPSLIPYTINSLTSLFHKTFLAGWIDGDGSFSISFNLDGSIKLVFDLCLDDNSLLIVNEIKRLIYDFTILNNIQTKNDDSLTKIGYIRKDKSISRFVIGGFQQIIKILIPFLDSFMILHTKKAIHYKIWKEVTNILANNINLEGYEGKKDFIKIVELAYNMNKEGKRRKLDKETYLNTILNTKYKGIE